MKVDKIKPPVEAWEDEKPPVESWEESNTSVKKKVPSQPVGNTSQNISQSISTSPSTSGISELPQSSVDSFQQAIEPSNKPQPQAMGGAELTGGNIPLSQGITTENANINPQAISEKYNFKGHAENFRQKQIPYQYPSLQWNNAETNPIEKQKQIATEQAIAEQTMSPKKVKEFEKKQKDIIAGTTPTFKSEVTPWVVKREQEEAIKPDANWLSVGVRSFSNGLLQPIPQTIEAAERGVGSLLHLITGADDYAPENYTPIFETINKGRDEFINTTTPGGDNPDTFIQKMAGGIGGLAGLVPNLMITPEVNLMKGVTVVPKFAVYEGLMGGVEKYNETGNISETFNSVKDGLEEGYWLSVLPGISEGVTGGIANKALKTVAKHGTMAAGFAAPTAIQGGSKQDVAVSAALGGMFAFVDPELYGNSPEGKMMAKNRAKANAYYFSEDQKVNNAIQDMEFTPEVVDEMSKKYIDLKTQQEGLLKEKYFPETENKTEWNKDKEDELNGLNMQVTALEKIMSVKAVSNDIVKDPVKYIKTIDADKTHTEVEKEQFKDKIKSTYENSIPLEQKEIGKQITNIDEQIDFINSTNVPEANKKADIDKLNIQKKELQDKLNPPEIKESTSKNGKTPSEQNTTTKEQPASENKNETLDFGKEKSLGAFDKITDIENNTPLQSTQEYLSELTGSTDNVNRTSKYLQTDKQINGKDVVIRVSDHSGVEDYINPKDYQISVVVNGKEPEGVSIKDNYTEIRISATNKNIEDKLFELRDTFDSIENEIKNKEAEQTKSETDLAFENITKESTLSKEEVKNEPIIEPKIEEVGVENKVPEEKAKETEFNKSLKRESVIEEMGKRYSDMTPEEIRSDIKENMGLSTDEKVSYQTKVDEFRNNPISFEKKSDKLIQDIVKSKKGTVNDLNHLLVNSISLKSQENNLRESLIGAEPKEKVKIQDEIIKILDKQYNNEIAASILGTQSSNIFRALQQVVKNDYSYAGMEKRYKQTRGIKGELTEEQKNEVKTDYEKDLLLQKNYDDALLREQQLKEENTILKNLIEEVMSDEKAEKKRTIKETKEQKIKKSNDKITVSKDKIKARLQEQRKQLSAGLPIDPIIAVEIGKMAKEKVYQGMVTLDAVTKSILEDVKDILPDWNERNIRDHLSGYGKESKPKTKNELSKQYIDIKKEAYWTSKYEDLLNGKITDKKEQKQIEENEIVKKIKEDYNKIRRAESEQNKLSKLENELKNLQETGELPERKKGTPKEISDTEKLIKEQIKYEKEKIRRAESEQNIMAEAEEMNLPKNESRILKDTKDLITYTKTQLTRIKNSKEQIAKDIKSIEETGKKTEKINKSYEESEELKNARLDLAVNRELLKQKEREALLKNRSKTEKVADAIYQYKRAMILLYPETFLKISGNVIGGVINKAPEALFLKGIHKGLKLIGREDISKGADVYGEAEINDIKTFYNTFLNHFTPKGREEWNKVKHIYGTEETGDIPQWLQIGGKSHQFVKNFLAHSEYEVAKDLLERKYIRDGRELDLSKPEVIKEIEQKAYAHSMYSILMNDNVVAKFWRNQIVRGLEKTIGKPATTFFVKMEVPIVRVPTNYIARQLTYGLGTIKGLAGTNVVGGSQKGLVELMIRGSKDLTPEQSNFILKNLSKGGMGLAYAALATVLYKKIATITDDSDDEFSKGVKKIAKKTAHVPFLDWMFVVGNTMNEAEKAAKNKGEKWDAMDYAKELLDEEFKMIKKVPFVNTMKYGIVGSFFQTNAEGKVQVPKVTTALMNSLISLVTPGVIRSWAAYTQDEDKGVDLLTPEEKKFYEQQGYYVRQPQTPMEAIYSAFPFLINKVPTNIERMINKKHLELVPKIGEDKEVEDLKEKKSKEKSEMTKEVKTKLGFEYKNEGKSISNTGDFGKGFSNKFGKKF